MSRAAPPLRPEYERTLEALTDVPQESVLPHWQRWWQKAVLRKTIILLLLALLWETAARISANELLLPTFTQTVRAFFEGIISGELLDKARISIAVLLQGYALGALAAFALTLLAASTQLGRDSLSILTSMFNPLPAIALLPLALLWFGLGSVSLIFVLAHSVLWSLALASFGGLQAVPETLRMTGQNYGLQGLRLFVFVLVPSALPSILSGLRIGWAFAWRTLIAAELFFGASSGEGGLGWYIFQNRNELYTDKVFAGLGSVILIGLAVEGLVFNVIERITVRRWGTQR